MTGMGIEEAGRVTTAAAVESSAGDRIVGSIVVADLQAREAAALRRVVAHV